ncbi:MAG: 5-formyltetrahydrofolate cyclo-ligase, partial [Pseudomonadota bacterium]
MSVAEAKAAARKAAFARRKVAHGRAGPGQSARLMEFLTDHRGKCIAGYMPINTEIDPLPAMAKAALHGPVAIPVIEAAGRPLRFARWTPDMPLVDGPFKARIPADPEFLVPEIIIVPLVAFDRSGGR